MKNRKLKKAGWKEKLLYLVGRRRGIIVEGNSMAPTLEHGDTVFVKITKKIKPNDIVLADHPFKKSVRILKRVAEITNDGKLNLIGDNPPESSDSRSFGVVSLDHITGKVVSRLDEKQK